MASLQLSSWVHLLVSLTLLISLLPSETLANQCHFLSSPSPPPLSCGLNYHTKQSCEEIGCCWDHQASSIFHACHVPLAYGYHYNQSVGSEDEESIFAGELTLKQSSGLKFSEDFQTLDFQVVQESVSRTHIKISPKNVDRWEVPESLLPRPGGNIPSKDAKTKTIVKNHPIDGTMEINIIRKDELEPIFTLSNQLMFQDQYIQLVLNVPKNVVATYGFGESTRSTQHMQYNTTYTLWATDWPSASFDKTIYGIHPFFIQITDDGKAHGAFFLNSNAMEATLFNSQKGDTLGIQMSGGLIDIYVFAGPTPAEVIQQYLEVIGKPAMVPYWSLGFHNCRWGYPNVSYVEDVVKNYSLANIPLETQWMDIDYMDSYLDFTLDPVNFPADKVATFIDNLHANHQHFVPIIDPGIYVRDSSYSTFKNGMEMDIFVKDLHGDTPYLGQVWPGPVYFPDWYHPNASSYWENELREFHNIMNFDGLWIDMNEISNFCNVNGNGQVCTLIESDPCDGNKCCIDCKTVDPTNPYDFPNFVPHVVLKSLAGKTFSMSALHFGNILEYNTHNMYGFMESIATRSALISILKERPFLLSRSTFAGSGKYTAHWTGDNGATWDNLAAAIVTMNNMALFGIPMVGSDICGFMGVTTEELCARWIEVGAFSPFSRNHNTDGMPPKELYRWESVSEAARNALALRYKLLPYLYTLMYYASEEGGTVHNGLWVHYPADKNARVQDNQFMWSDGVLFTPVTEKGSVSVTGYFPTGMWYSLFDDSAISSTGTFVTLDTPLTKTNAHVRGGAILPMQHSAMTTLAVKTSPFTLLVSFDDKMVASGRLFLDDGKQVDIENYSLIEYSADAQTLVSSLKHATYDNEGTTLEQIAFQFPASQGSIKSCTSNIHVDHLNKVITPTVTVTSFSNFVKVILSIDSVDQFSIVNNFKVSWDCDKGNL